MEERGIDEIEKEALYHMEREDELNEEDDDLNDIENEEDKLQDLEDIDTYAIVQKILSEDAIKYPSIAVERKDIIQVDVGNFSVFDVGPIEVSKFNEDKEEYLKDTTRNGIQYLFHHVFSLATQQSGANGVLAKIPIGKTILPREKHIPKKETNDQMGKICTNKRNQKEKKRFLHF